MKNSIDRWIFAEYSAPVADLAIFRMLYASVMLLSRLPRAMWVIGLPSAFYSPPPGPAALWTDWPEATVILGLNWLLLVSLVALLIGWRTCLASVMTGVCFIALSCWTYASAKIDHDILLGLAPLALAGSGWGKRYSVDARRAAVAPDAPAKGWCLSLLAMLIAVGMATAGWAKLSSGWLAPSTQSAYGFLVQSYGRGLGTGLLSEDAVKLPSPWLWESADWFATWMELGFLVAVLRQSTFRFALALAAIFHLANWPLYNIVFDKNVIVYGAFVPWSRLIPARTWAPSQTMLAVIGLSALTAGTWQILTESSPLAGTLNRSIILFGATIALGYFVWLAGWSLPWRSADVVPAQIRRGWDAHLVSAEPRPLGLDSFSSPGTEPRRGKQDAASPG